LKEESCNQKRAELFKIQHKSIQAVAEGIRVGKLLRNVVALRNVNAMFVSLNFYWDELDPAGHTKERLWWGKKS